MNRDYSPLAVEGLDPWDTIEIDGHLCRLAERAATAAGLSIEDWLERAIRRTCAELIAAATPSVQRPTDGPGSLFSAPWQPSESDTETPPETADLQPATDRDSAHWTIDLRGSASVSPTPDRSELRAEPAERDMPRAEPAMSDDWEPTPATPVAPQRGGAGWSVIRRLAKQQALRRLPISDVTLPPDPQNDGDVAATMETAASAVARHPETVSDVTVAPESSEVTDPFAAAPTLSAAEGGRTVGATEDPAVDSEWEFSPPPAQPRAPRPPVGQHHWLIVGVSSLAALLIGIVVAPYLMSPAPVARSSGYEVSLPPAPTPAPRQEVVIPIPDQASPAAAAPMTPAAILAPETPAPPPASDTQSPAAGAAPVVLAPAKPVPAPVGVKNEPPAAKPAPAKPAPEAKAPEAKPAKAAADLGPSDPKQLALWLEDRAKTGDPVSQYRLGVLFALGQAVPQDYQRAAQLFRAAAEADVPEAEYNVAVMYNEGMGMARDLGQALFWYRKAADAGNANAAFNLGVAYSSGAGVAQNMDEAARWFRHAAAQGVVNAQYNLALLYERGNGVPLSEIEAYAWYAAAASRGDKEAIKNRDRLATTLSPSQMKDAEARTAKLQQTIMTTSQDAGLIK